MPKAKQQHFVQRAYLDGFLRPGSSQLVCYGRKGISFRKEPAELAMRRKYYSVKNDDGSWDDRQEDLIEQTIETPGLAVIQKLISGKTRLKWEDRTALALYVAFQEQRTPTAREQARTMSRMFNERLLSDIKAANPNQTSIGLGGKDGTITSVGLDEIVRSHEELCDDHAMPIHKIQIGTTFEIQRFYQQMKWTIHYALGQERFVTTDTPVIRVYYASKSHGSGLDRADIEIRYPLSAKALMTITHDRPRAEALVKATERQRRKILDTLQR